jgi:hypothetical protein
MNNPTMPRHGRRRFWDTVEDRYTLYSRPECIDARCQRCDHRVPFRTQKLPHFVLDVETGGYFPDRGDIGGDIVGRGACANCGRIVRSIAWPDAAYFKVRVPEGIVWAWNASYVPILRTRVAGDRVALRHLVGPNWDFARFVSRLPRFALLTKNRARILVGLESLEERERVS